MFTMYLLSYQYEFIHEPQIIFFSYFYHADTNKYFVLISGLRYTMAGTHPSSDQVFFSESTIRQHKIHGL